MKSDDLKECPRCMADDGYIINATTIRKRVVGWDNKTKSEHITYKTSVAHCKCCGLIIIDEVERLRNEK